MISRHNSTFESMSGAFKKRVHGKNRVKSFNTKLNFVFKIDEDFFFGTNSDNVAINTISDAHDH